MPADDSDRAGRGVHRRVRALCGPVMASGRTLAGLPMALLLALSALFLGAVAVSGTAAGARFPLRPAPQQILEIRAVSLVPPIAHVGRSRSGQLAASGPESLPRTQPSANWSLAPRGFGARQIEPLEGGRMQPVPRLAPTTKDSFQCRTPDRNRPRTGPFHSSTVACRDEGAVTVA